VPLRTTGSRTAKGLALIALLALTAVGCVRFEAAIRVDKNGGVQVTEKVAVDEEWRATIQDTMNASKQVIDQYVKEARLRGGSVKASGTDSARADFRYPSIAAFARSWPDSSDDGQLFDRSVYHHLNENGVELEELILFRMSPPDPKERQRLQNQKMPVLRFAIVLPTTPVRHNAHHVSGQTYWWQFSETMTKPDSVWLVWPTKPGS
jgi:hypothetical protein